jgi:hypothetical protein
VIKQNNNKTKQKQTTRQKETNKNPKKSMGRDE